MIEERILKQNYLKEQIIGNSYNPKEFTKFIKSKKENGTEIDNWSFKSLKKIVNEFQKNNKIENIVNYDIEKDYEYNIKLLNKNKNNFFKEITCNISFKNNFEKNKIIDVKIIESKIVKTTVNDYQNYYIETVPNKFKTKRRYKEFQVLDNNLRIYFPYLYIPPLPPKKVGLNKNTNLVYIRLCLLEDYLQKLFKHPEIKNSIILEAFLSISDFNIFKKLLESKKLEPRNYYSLFNNFKIENFSKKFKIENFETQNGEVL